MKLSLVFLIITFSPEFTLGDLIDFGGAFFRSNWSIFSCKIF